MKNAERGAGLSLISSLRLRVTLATKRVHPDRPVIAFLTGAEISDVVRAVRGVVVVPSGVDDDALEAVVEECLNEGDRS